MIAESRTYSLTHLTCTNSPTATNYICRIGGLSANVLALGDQPWAEQVKLDFPGDVGDAGLAGFSGGEVAGFLGFAGAVAVWAVADGGAGEEYFEQKRGEGVFELVRGGKPRRCPSRLPGRAGS